MRDAHHSQESIEYLTPRQHTKRHGERPQWLVGAHGSWKRDKKRQRLATSRRLRWWAGLLRRAR